MPRSSRIEPPVVEVLAGESAAPVDGPAVLRPARSLLADRLAFLRGFVAQPSQVGSIVPSSGHLEDRLVQATGAAHARTIVELGPGTGGTTRALLRAMPHDARLLAIELSPAFHRRLVERIADGRLALQLGSAEELAELLQSWRLPAPDAVLSGIPFSTMPAEVAQRIAATVSACLAPGGRFVAYQVRAHVARYFAPHLGAPEIRWEWRNVPPLRVFRWTRTAIAAAR